MTRINLVPPQALTSKHLVAEYRELPRVFNLVRRHVKADRTPYDLRLPETFTLGTGHVRFFYDKLQWVLDRHTSLNREMSERSYVHNLAFPSSVIADIPDAWKQNYIPSPTAVDSSWQRLAEKDPEAYGPSARAAFEYRQYVAPLQKHDSAVVNEPEVVKQYLRDKRTLIRRLLCTKSWKHAERQCLAYQPCS